MNPHPLPFCDFLSVTYALDHSPRDDLHAFLLDVGAVPIDGQLWRLEKGTIQLRAMPSVWYASFSGACLAHLRHRGLLLDLLWVLSTCPHRVTRLDAALDVLTDAPPVLRSLRRRHKTGRVNFGHKALPTTTMLSRRESDGEETGTFYVGRRTRARCTARVYDKQAEALANRGERLPPTTRYEITVKTEYGATLRDAAEPERLFWHVAGDVLLPRPPDVHPWSGAWAEGFFTVKREGRPLAQVLGRRIDNSPELDVLTELADKLGPEGRRYLARLLLKRLAVPKEMARDLLPPVEERDRRETSPSA